VQQKASQLLSVASTMFTLCKLGFTKPYVVFPLPVGPIIAFNPGSIRPLQGTERIMLALWCNASIQTPYQVGLLWSSYIKSGTQVKVNILADSFARLIGGEHYIARISCFIWRGGNLHYTWLSASLRVAWRYG